MFARRPRGRPVKFNNQNQSVTKTDKIYPNGLSGLSLGLSGDSGSCPGSANSSRSSGSRTKRKSGAGGPLPSSEADGLETTAKYVGRSNGRAARFRHQRHAAGLLCGKHRVGLCRWSVVSKQAGVDVVASSYGDSPKHVHYEGLQTCGSVWVCPCCSARISETRREEVGKLLSWARANGYKVRMMTLTARHGVDDELSDLLLKMKGRTENKKKGIDAFYGAKQRLVQHRRYKALKNQIIGTVTATEVTYGRNGWHPHMHVIIVLREDVDLMPLRGAWLGALKGVGLEGTGAGWDVREADEVGEYIAKWGAAEELTLSKHKKARKGMTPQQLLAASCDEGNTKASELWCEYAAEFQGKRQLVWSNHLKDMIGLNDITDKEAAADTRQDDQVEVERANVSYSTWKGRVVRRRADRRAELADRAEEIGPVEAVLELETNGLGSGDDLIEAEVSYRYQPKPGGLVERMMELMRESREGSLSSTAKALPKARRAGRHGLLAGVTGAKAHRAAQEPSRTAGATSEEGDGGQGPKGRAGGIRTAVACPE